MVIISLSVTQLKGYGHKEACWLNADKGLIWAFIVPALGVILVSKKIHLTRLASSCLTQARV